MGPGNEKQRGDSEVNELRTKLAESQKDELLTSLEETRTFLQECISI